jgi:hypothetical protein
MSSKHEEPNPFIPKQNDATPLQQLITLEQLAAKFLSDNAPTTDVRAWFHAALDHRQSKKNAEPSSRTSTRRDLTSGVRKPSI